MIWPGLRTVHLHTCIAMDESLNQIKIIEEPLLTKTLLLLIDIQSEVGVKIR